MKSRRPPSLSLVSVILMTLTGCSYLQSRVDLDAAIASAREEMLDSRSDYELCVKDQDELPDLSCDLLHDIYQEDAEAYEALLAQRKARGR